MYPQREGLLERLRNAGWIVASCEEAPFWWAYEVWTLHSDWSPASMSAFLYFLVDPMAPAGAPASDHVWAVAASRSPVLSHVGPWEAELSLGQGWAIRLDDFIRNIHRLRGPVAG